MYADSNGLLYSTPSGYPSLCFFVPLSVPPAAESGQRLANMDQTKASGAVDKRIKRGLLSTASTPPFKQSPIPAFLFRPRCQYQFIKDELNRPTNTAITGTQWKEGK